MRKLEARVGRLRFWIHLDNPWFIAWVVASIFNIVHGLVSH